MTKHFTSYRKRFVCWYCCLVVALGGCGLKDFTGLSRQSSVMVVGATARVDQNFRFTPPFPNGIVGPYAILGKPNWLEFDSLTGQLTGIPDATSVSTTVQIRGVAGQSGEQSDTPIPILIEIAGDPLLQQQWGQYNSKQSGYAHFTGKIDEDLNVRPVIRSGVTGEGVTIAISDEGLDINHEDLKSNVLPGASKNYDPLGLSNDPSILKSTSDNPGAFDHGTSVAGIIAMTGWNGVGGRGIAPKSKIAGLNFIRFQSETSLLDQVSRPFDIVNQSWGSSETYFVPENLTYRRALETGATEFRNGKGTIYVKAAGNEFQLGVNSAFDPYNKNPQTIVVGATNGDGVHSSYSSAGANLWVSGIGGEYGLDTYLRNLLESYLKDPAKPDSVKQQIETLLRNPDYFSPAVLTTDNSTCERGYSHRNVENSLLNFPLSIFNFDLSGGGLGTPHRDNLKCDYTSTFNGTSAATPSVTGVIALMLEKKPSLSWRDVKFILAKTARKIDPDSKNIINSEDPTGHVNDLGWIRNQANFNFHNYYGFGRVDALAAVNMAGTYVSSLRAFQSPADFFVDVVDNGGLDIPDNDASGVTRVITTPSTSPAFVEAVEIEVTITHEFPRDLSLELKSPSGSKSIVLNSNKFAPCQTVNIGGADVCDPIRDLSAVRFLSNAFYGETGVGNWELKVVDAKAGNTGKIVNWKLKVFGN